MDTAAANDLLAALDRFLERAAASAAKLSQAPAEAAFLRAIRQRFKAQRDWVLNTVLPQYRHLMEARLREADDPPQPVANTAEILQTVNTLLQQFDDYKDDPALLEKLNAAIEMAFATGSKSLIAEISPELQIMFGGNYPSAVQYLVDHAFENVGAGIDATTAAGIRDIVTEGLANGESYGQIAKAISDEYAGISSARAQLIASTEIGNAYNEGTLQAAQSLESKGVTMEKAWLTAGDDKVDPDCEANEAQGWIDLGDMFPSGDERPLAHPGCRCSLLSRAAKAVPVLA